MRKDYPHPRKEKVRPGLYTKAEYVAPAKTLWQSHEEFLAQFSEGVELQMARDLVRQQELERLTQTKIERPNKVSERDQRIVEMRLDKEMTLEAIGALEGLSRERVRQILSRVEKIAGVRFPRYAKREERVDLKCAFIGGCEVMGQLSKYNADKGRHYYCDAHKGKHSVMVLKVPNWYELSDNEQERARYHHDPKRKAMSRVFAKRWREQIRKDPVQWARYRLLQKAAALRWRARHMHEPDFIEKQRIASHNQYLKNKAKPGWKEKETARYRRYTALKKAEALAHQQKAF